MFQIMRTAVCFFGEIRGTPEHWKKVYDAIVEPNNADVFMSLSIYDRDFIQSYTAEQQELLLSYYKDKGVHYYPPRELLELFKPKLLKCNPRYEYSLDHYNLFIDKVNPENSLTVNGNYSYDCTKLSYYAIMNQSDTRSSVIALKHEYEQKTNTKYDNVIFTRLDINPQDKIQFHSPLENISASGSYNYIFEQIIVGPSDKMNIFMKLLEQIPDLYVKNCTMEHHFMQNEYHLYKFLEQNNIPVDFIDISLNRSVMLNGLTRFNFSFQ